MNLNPNLLMNHPKIYHLQHTRLPKIHNDIMDMILMDIPLLLPFQNISNKHDENSFRSLPYLTIHACLDKLDIVTLVFYYNIRKFQNLPGFLHDNNAHTYQGNLNECIYVLLNMVHIGHNLCKPYPYICRSLVSTEFAAHELTFYIMNESLRLSLVYYHNPFSLYFAIL